jgi:hypothetical protein
MRRYCGIQDSTDNANYKYVGNTLKQYKCMEPKHGHISDTAEMFY